MNKTFGFLILFLVAGLALIGLSPGNTLEHLSSLGIALLASSLVLATQLEKKSDYKTLLWISGVALAITITLIIVLPRVFSP